MNNHLVFLDFGFFEIYWFGFLVGCAVITASVMYCILRRKQGYSVNDSTVTLLLALPSAFVISRLSYCWFRQSSFSEGFSKLFDITFGGYSLHGALAGVLIVLLLQSRKKQVSVLAMLDSASPALSAAIAIGRFAGITGEEELGFEVKSGGGTLPFLVWSDAEQGWMLWVGFFEGICALLITGLTLTLFVRKYSRNNPGLGNGCVVLFFMLTYGLSQAFLESMRGDSLFMVTLGFVRIDQILSILLAVSAVIIIFADNCRECGFSVWKTALWTVSAAALTGAVICEFSLNATYLALIYLCMFSLLAVIGSIAAVLFFSTVKARAARASRTVRVSHEPIRISREDYPDQSNQPATVKASTRRKSTVPSEQPGSISIQTMNGSSLDDLIDSLNLENKK